jgi:hypothetical protein
VYEQICKKQGVGEKMDYQTSSGAWNQNQYSQQAQNPYLQMGSYIPQLIGMFHPAITGYKSNANSLSRLQARSSVRSAYRSKEGYEEKSARDRELLDQDLAGRGLGVSSIANEDKTMFEHARERAIADLNENIAIARQQQTTTNYAIKAQRVNGYMNMFSSFLGMAGGIVGGAF